MLKHNIWYGFVRNLVGGSILAMVASVIAAILGAGYFRNGVLTITSFILFFGYLTYYGFRKKILIQYAEDYAKQLIAEYMHISKSE